LGRQCPNGPRWNPGPHPSAARITSDAALESTGAAGKAQALTDRNDPNTTPAKARTDVFDIKFISLIEAVERLHTVVVFGAPWVHIVFVAAGANKMRQKLLCPHNLRFLFTIEN
jgi:hypothetical protein